ncbi:MAG: hypothetical protein QOK35_1931, partial [Pseudonocardiales bacterium]|nr:hypothetical protein [Pseudonocardiales bacterium]
MRRRRVVLVVVGAVAVLGVLAGAVALGGGGTGT